MKRNDVEAMVHADILRNRLNNQGSEIKRMEHKIEGLEMQLSERIEKDEAIQLVLQSKEKDNKTLRAELEKTNHMGQLEKEHFEKQKERY